MTDYYVKKTGNNSDPGSEAEPWLTIQKAANTMIAGDSVTVYVGTYTERVTESTSGSSGNLITFQINSGDTVTVDGGFALSGDYIRVDGFSQIEATGSTWSTAGTGVYITGDYCEVEDNYLTQCTLSGIRIGNSTSTNCTIKGNHIYQVALTGMEIRGSNHLIEDNEIEDLRCVIGGVSYSDLNGISLFGSGHTVRGNYMHDILYANNPGRSPHIDGFQTWNHGEYAGEGANNCIIERNWIELPDATGANTTGTGFQLAGTNGGISNLTIKNNIIKCFRGILMYYDHDGHNIVNNTFIGDLDNTMAWTPRGISIELGGSYTIENLTIKNNIVVEQPWGHIYLTGISNGDGDGNVIDWNCKYNSDDSTPLRQGEQANDVWMQDPKVVTRWTDLQLQSGSPCINVGADLSGTVDDDYDGTERPQGSVWDMGAFEYREDAIEIHAILRRG